MKKSKAKKRAARLRAQLEDLVERIVLGKQYSLSILLKLPPEQRAITLYRIHKDRG